jgi:hypothetical protein
MRNNTHNDQIERWGRFVRDNPNSWKKEHSEFIDSQILKSQEFFNRLLSSRGGREKIRKLREFKLSKQLNTSKHNI